jgi:hypothetical protein
VQLPTKASQIKEERKLFQLTKIIGEKEEYKIFTSLKSIALGKKICSPVNTNV